jgi:pimeloyl-ACP methyl ester carboxylesterase
MIKQSWFICIVMIFGVECCPAQTVPRWKTLPDIPAMPKPDSSGMVTVKGARSYFAVFNKAGKEPVILLHGGFGSSDDWAFEVPLLLSKHQVIVVDTRGHGRSTMGDMPFSYELFASDLSILMDSLRIQNVSIVGWSDGGITGLVMAMKHSSKVNKLFTFGANYNKSGEKDAPPDSAMSAKFMARVKNNYQKLSPAPAAFAALRAQIIKLYSSEPNLDTTALQKINLPVVIACGEYEQFYTRQHFESLVRLIPGAKLLVLPAVSHGGPWQDPAGFHAAVALLLDDKK